jgi:hypothetical protein
MTATFAKRAFTLAEYYRMAEVGILANDERVELLDGEIILMTPLSTRRASCLRRLTRFLVLQRQAILSSRNPVRLDNYTELCPDAALLKWQHDFYSTAHPWPQDTHVIIEVLDESHLHSKQSKYAQAGVPEFWLVDLVNHRIEVHALPNEGVYQEVRIILRHQNIISRALPHLKLKASDILG